MMKPAVAPMVKPAYIDGIRMFEGVPAETGLRMTRFQLQHGSYNIASGVGDVKLFDTED
jgi:hypothetical protein